MAGASEKKINGILINKIAEKSKRRPCRNAKTTCIAGISAKVGALAI